MTWFELLSHMLSAGGGVALTEVIRWARRRDEREGNQRVLSENIAIATLQSQVGRLQQDVATLQAEIIVLRLENHAAQGQLNAAHQTIFGLKDEVNDELRNQGKPERYDLQERAA